MTLTFVPLFLAGVAVVNAGVRYERGEGGFKLGVDLVGGTILVYEVDQAKQFQDKDKFNMQVMAESLKRRIDPNDLKNVTIRPVGENRVEIILPTGGAHQARIEEQAWQQLLEEVRAKSPELASKEVVPMVIIYRKKPKRKSRGMFPFGMMKGKNRGMFPFGMMK